MKRNILATMIRDESGATAIEYGLIVAFISVAIIAVFPRLEGFLAGVFDNIGDALDGAPGGAG